MKKRTTDPPTLAPIRASAAVELKYRKELQTLVNAMHRDFKRMVLVELKRQPPQMAQDDSLPDMLKRTMQAVTKKWLGKFEQVSEDIARKFITGSKQHTETAMLAALRDVGFTVKFSMTDAAKEGLAAVLHENVGLIKSIPERYLQQVQGDVWRSVASGYDLHTLTNTLQQRYGATRKRAELIARDQTSKAKAAIEQARRKELGITKAIWQHSGAGKHPRESHVAANGKEFDIDKGMYIDGKWILPGTEINCRCTSRSIIPGFN